MFTLMVDVQTIQLWIRVFTITTLIIFVDVTEEYPLFPAGGQWMCNAGDVIPNVTVRGGIQAGEFKKIGAVGDIKSCVRYCCEDRRCDVAFEAKGTCYLVSCDNDYLCQAVPAQKSDLHPQIVYITRTKLTPSTSSTNRGLGTYRNKLNSQSFGDVSDERSAFSPPQGQNIDPFGSKDKTVVRNTVNQFDMQASDALRNRLNQGSKLIPQTNAVEVGGKKNEIGRINVNPGKRANSGRNRVSKDYLVTPENCFPTRVHQDVSLRWGTRSGKFSDYGDVGNMKKCVDLCCKDKTCDVAFMIGKICYTVSCSSFELCQMVRKPHGNRLLSQLAYVIKKADKSHKKKLQMSRDHERMLEKQSEKQLGTLDAPSNYNNDDIVLPKSDISPMEEPNVPSKVTKGCKHNTILSNYGLVGGQKAGIYTLRGRTPNFQTCVGLCCADPACDAAFLLGKSCYSVQCYRDGKCAGRAARSHGLQSKLAFIERKDPQDLSAKRTAIPGLLPTDRRFTVILNITNEDYKEGLRDPESLEFLNFAEALRSAINGLYGNVEGYKYAEVLKFRPNKVIAMFNLTADRTTHPKVLLQILADALRKGEIRTYEEPVSGRMTLDVRGFKFMNSKGENLVCPPEYNYETHWPLAIYGTAVNVPCPRNAKGLTNRKCTGNDEEKATWEIPDFSNCVSQKYEDLLREVQLLTSTSIHSPELTSASIVDRLLQMATADTYGPNPPPIQNEAENVAATKSLVRPFQSGQHRSGLHNTVGNNGHAPFNAGKPPKINLKSFYQNNKQGARRPTSLHHRLVKNGQPRARTSQQQAILDKFMQSHKKIKPKYTQNQQPGNTIMSQGYWSLPHKDNGQESPEKAVTSVRDYPGKMYKTLSLPVSNIIKPAPMKWDLTRHLPTRYPTQSHDKVTAPLNQNPPPAEYSAPNGGGGAKEQVTSPDPIYIAPAPARTQVYSRTLDNPQGKPGIPATGNSNQFKPVGNAASFVPQVQYSPLGGNVDDVDRKKYLVSIKKKRKTEEEEKKLDKGKEKRQTCCEQEIADGNIINIVKNATDLHLASKKSNVKQSYIQETPRFDKEYDSPVGYSASLLSFKETKQRKQRSPIDREFLNIRPLPAPSHNDTSLSKERHRQRRDLIEEYSRANADIVASLLDDTDYETYRGVATVTAAREPKDPVIELYQAHKRTYEPSPKLHIIEKAFYKPNDDEAKKVDINIEKASVKHTVNQAKTSSNGQSVAPMTMNVGGHVIDRPVIIDVSGPVKKIVSGVPPILRKSNSSLQGTNFDIAADSGYPKDQTSVNSNSASQNSKDVGSYTESHLDRPNANAVAGTNIHQNGEAVNSQFPVKLKADSSSSVEVGSAGQGSWVSQPIPAPVPAPIETPPPSVPVTPEAPPPAQPPPPPPPSSPPPSPPPEPVQPVAPPPAPPPPLPEVETQPTRKVDSGPPKEEQGGSKEMPLPVSEGSQVPSDQSATPQDTNQVPPPGQPDSQPVQVEEPSITAQPEVPQEGTVEAKGGSNQNGDEDANQFGAAKPGEQDTGNQEAKVISVQVNNASESLTPAVDASSVSMSPLDANESVNKIETGLVANETEENAYKLGPQSKTEEPMVFSYDKEKGKDPAPMFGGDILIAADIVEELQKYSQGQTEAPTFQEVKEFLQAVSAILDNRNALEWKNAQRHMKVMASDSDTSYQQLDSTDWRSIHKVKSQRVPDILLELVSNVEKYGRAIGQLMSRFNKQFQKPIITENIVYQLRIFMAEELSDNLSPDNVVSFPDYTDQRLQTWSKQRDLVSLPVFLFSEAFEPKTLLHVFFFWFKTVHGLQRFQSEMDERDTQEILDEPSMKLSSQLLSLSVEPSMGSNLRLPVTIVLQNAENFQPKARHECAFWNETRDAWSIDGCKLVGINDTHTTCQCDHMTTYGVLVDDSRPQAPPVDETTAPLQPPPSSEKVGEEIKGGSSSSSETGITEGGSSNKGGKEDEGKSGGGKGEGSEGGAEKPPPASTTTTEKPKPQKKTTKKGTPTEDSGREGEEKGKNGTLIVLIIIIVLLLLILLILLICFLCWYRRRRAREEGKTKKLDTSSSSSGSAPRDENLIDKSELEPKGKSKQAPGSASSSRTNSPDPGQSPGWRKLMSHAHHPESMLMKEKALLFADYHQPYNFLSRDQEKPNTSLESVYGSEAPTTADLTPPSDGRVTPGTKRKRPPRSYDRAARDRHRLRHGPRHGTRGPDLSHHSRSDPNKGDQDSSVRDPRAHESRPSRHTSKPSRSHRDSEEPVKKKEAHEGERNAPPERSARQKAPSGEKKPKEQHVMPSNLTESHSMEWDPYLDTKQKEERLKGERKPTSNRKKRNISPISEEPGPHDGDPPMGSVEPQVGSDHRGLAVTPSETSYPISVDDTTHRGPNSAATNAAKRKDDKGTKNDKDQGANRGSYSGNSEDSESASPPEKRIQRAEQATDSSASSRESLPREQEKTIDRKEPRPQKRVDR